jgi:hypothetical protein
MPVGTPYLFTTVNVSERGNQTPGSSFVSASRPPAPENVTVSFLVAALMSPVMTPLEPPRISKCRLAQARGTSARGRPDGGNPQAERDARPCVVERGALDRRPTRNRTEAKPELASPGSICLTSARFAIPVPFSEEIDPSALRLRPARDPGRGLAGICRRHTGRVDDPTFRAVLDPLVATYPCTAN